MTFVVFAVYGVFAAAVRGHVISRPRVVTWMRRTFAGAFVALGGQARARRSMSVQRGLFIPPFDELVHPHLLAELASRAEARGWNGFFLWDHVRYRAPVARSRIRGSRWPPSPVPPSS